MTWPRLAAFVGVCSLLVLAACRPEIGDQCASSVECPEGGSCDTSISNGYCLLYDCEYSACPDNSVCIEFRTFTACMQYCESNGDCRTDEGHVCRNDLAPSPFCFLPAQEPQ